VYEFPNPGEKWTTTDRLFGLSLLAIAAIVAVLVAGDARRDYLATGWPKVACVIRASEVREEADPGHEGAPYVFRVAYAYRWRGQPYFGRVYRRHYQGAADVAAADRLAGAYPVGARSACFVNPAKPHEAILVHEGPRAWPLAALLLIGCTAMLFMLHFLPMSLWPHSTAWKERGDFGVGLIVCLLGTAAFAYFPGSPLRETWEGAGWTPTPCVVTSGTVRTTVHRGEHSIKVYRPDLLFAYSVKGRRYRSSRYNFTDLATPWYYGARGVVARNPPGAPATCYVDPRDPSSAVLTRGVNSTVWCGLLPLAMMAGGSAGMAANAGRAFGGKGGEPPALALRVARFHWDPPLTAALAGLATLTTLELGADLIQDWRAGCAEWPEALAVAGSAAVALALASGFWIGLRRAADRADRLLPARDSR